MKKFYRTIGLMSGSSLDGLDIACCEMSRSATDQLDPIIEWKLVQAATLPYSAMWQSRLTHLPNQSAIHFAKTHTYFGHYLAELVNNYLWQHPFEPDFIASHGHTIFHDPAHRFTSQIGDGAALAALTGYPVISDFRYQDVAIDGEGAPLAPIADRLLFKGYDFYLNIGGIANISCHAAGRYIAFDVGPANQVLNALAAEAGLAYDAEGRLAAQGQPVTDLHHVVDQLAYFQKPYPKSLGNEWVRREVLPLYMENEATLADRLHTACRQLARQTALAIENIIKKEQLQKADYQLFISGGGAFNNFLIQCIHKACTERLKLKIVLPERPIIEFKEAILMALMGLLRLENIPNCMASVTGAQRDTISGSIHQGHHKLVS